MKIRHFWLNWTHSTTCKIVWVSVVALVLTSNIQLGILMRYNVATRNGRLNGKTWQYHTRRDISSIAVLLFIFILPIRYFITVSTLLSWLRSVPWRSMPFLGRRRRISKTKSLEWRRKSQNEIEWRIKKNCAKKQSFALFFYYMMFPPGKSSNIFRSDNKITYIAWVTYFSTISFVMFCVFWGVLVFFRWSSHNIYSTSFSFFILLFQRDAGNIFWALKTTASCSEKGDRANFFWHNEQWIEKKSTKNKWLLYVHIYYHGELLSSRSGH